MSKKIPGAKYSVGQVISFKQRHCKRNLSFSGEITLVEKVLAEVVYHCTVSHSDGMLFAIVPEFNITAVQANVI